MKTNKLSLSVSFIIILMLTLGLNGCTSEMQQEAELNPNATLMLNTNLKMLGSDASEANESSVKTLRVLVYEAFGSGSSTTYGNQIGSEYITSNQLEEQNIVLKVEFKKRDQVAAFLIANEEAGWGLANKSISVDELKNLAITYGNTVKAPFKMYEETGVFSGQSNTNRTVSLVRNVARVDVQLTCKATEMSNLAQGGMLQLTQARLLNMAKTTQLCQAINEYTFGKGGYIDGTTITFTENENYQTTYTNGVFAGFTTLNSDKSPGSLTFYVPEHFVKEVGTHTYMTIEGKYYPTGNGKSVNVVYTLPIGEVVTTDKINGAVSFTPTDLRITRNFQYNMKAQIKKIEQISDVVVSVEKWKEKPIDGTIKDEKASLNVSTIQTSVSKGAQDHTLVQFWSDQTSNQVRILESGNVNGTPFAVNSIFENLADTDGQTTRPANIWFNDTSSEGQEYKSWGHLKLKLRADAAVTVGNIYTITLAAGTLHRTIKVEITTDIMKEQQK